MQKFVNKNKKGKKRLIFATLNRIFVEYIILYDILKYKENVFKF